MLDENISSSQDLMVSLNTVSDPILTSKSQNRRDIWVSYWEGIVPKDHPEIASNRPWLVVHTAPPPSPSFEQPEQLKTRIVHSGNAFLPRGGKYSFCGWDTPLSFMRLELSTGYLQRVTTELGMTGLVSSQGLQVLHTHEPKILQVGSWLLEELVRGNRAVNFYVDTLVNLLAFHILLHTNTPADRRPNHHPSPLVSQDVARAIEYMRAHLSEDISLADLSRIVHISPSQLGRLFRRSTNLTPHQYLILLRVAHARELLRSGMLPISKVASQSGFVDQSHLNRHFKRIYGVTPKTSLNGR